MRRVRTVYVDGKIVGKRDTRETAWELALQACAQYRKEAEVYIGTRKVASVSPGAPELEQVRDTACDTARRSHTKIYPDGSDEAALLREDWSR